MEEKPVEEHERIINELNFGTLLAKTIKYDWIEIFVMVLIFINMWGSVIAFMLFLKTNLSQFVGLDEWIWVIICTIPLLVSCFFEDLK